MSKDSWRKLIISALEGMAEEDICRREWAGIGPNGSSLVEIICHLFDDALMREYVKLYESDLNPIILSLAREFDRKVLSFNAEYFDTLPVLEAIDRPEWIEIRNIAVKLKSAFEREEIAE